MTSQDRQRAQRDALQAAKTPRTGDRERAYADALARYLRLQAAAKPVAPKPEPPDKKDKKEG